MSDFQKLYRVLGDVLGDSLQRELDECMLETKSVAGAAGPLQYRFEEWLTAELKRTGSCAFLINQLGKSNTKKVIARIAPGAAPTGIVTTEQLSTILIETLGVPDLEVVGRAHYSARCAELQARVREDNADHGVASELRQLSERMLREVTLVALNTPLATLFLDALKKDERIRLPNRSALRESLVVADVLQMVADESVADLGFLILLVGRASAPLRRGVVPPGAGLLDAELVTKSEEESLHSVAKALQLYAHFRPGQEASRYGKLEAALENLGDAVRSMADRRAIPDAVVLYERVSGCFGTSYVGRNETGAEVCLRTEDELPLGCRVLYREISNPVRRVAGWVRSPWK